MKSTFILTAIIYLSSLLISNAQSYQSFKTSYNKAISLEFLGVSPRGSINFDFVPYKRPKGFINCQLGIGVISTVTDRWSFPQAITYNYWLNQGRKNKRMSRDCNPERREKKLEYFIEGGLGHYLLSPRDNNGNLNYLFPVTGLRIHYMLNRRNVCFAKLRYLPVNKYKHQERFVLPVGVAIGCSF